MAKQKKNVLTEDELFAEIAAETDGTILAEMDQARFYFDTGSLAVNYICSGKYIGGGIPGDKITEIYGPSSSGKTYLASNTLFGCQQIDGWAIILDCENATNAEFMARTSHLNLTRVLRYTPISLERAFLKIHNTVRTIREREKALERERKPILVVYDSISVSPCERELKESNLPEDYKASDWKKIVGRQEQPGERAKVCSKEFRKIMPLLEKEGVTLLIINQTREKIGVLYGNPETTAGGGNALPFYASCRLRTASRRKIENKELKTFAGVNMHVKNVKNRTFKPFVETEGVKLFFDTGINPLSGLLTMLIQSERIVPKSPGNYTVAEKYLLDPTQPYNFKASKELNEVPMQVLCDCPALVDAKDSEEVRKYMSVSQDAIDNSNSEAFSEKAVAFDADGNPTEYDDETAELD